MNLIVGNAGERSLHFGRDDSGAGRDESGAVGMTVGRWVTIEGIVLLLLASLSCSTLAAEATPAPFTTDPAQCTVAPRALDELEQIVARATPTPKRDRPVAGDPIDLDSDTGKTVTSTLETLLSCLNAGDRLRAYALYTDAYLASILQPGDLPAVATPQPPDPDEQTRIVTIELHSLPNGAVLATVTLDPALIPVHKIFDFILIPIDDHWRIDRVINEIDFSLP